MKKNRGKSLYYPQFIKESYLENITGNPVLSAFSKQNCALRSRGPGHSYNLPPTWEPEIIHILPQTIVSSDAENVLGFKTFHLGLHSESGLHY